MKFTLVAALLAGASAIKIENNQEYSIWHEVADPAKPIWSVVKRGAHDF